MTSREWLEDPVIVKIKRYSLKRGNNGIRELVNFFKSYSKDGVNLTPQEIQTGLTSRGIPITPVEVKHLVHAFDTDKNGKASIGEFIRAFVSMIPQRRQRVINQAFQSLGPDDNGCIPLDRLLNNFDSHKHPMVADGTLSADEAFQNVTMYFNEQWNPSGVVTFDDFLSYYAGVSHNVPDDEYFERHMCSVYSLEDYTLTSNTSFGTLHAAFQRGKPTKGAQKSEPISVHHRSPVASQTLQTCYLHTSNSRNYDATITQTAKKAFHEATLKDRAPHTFPVVYETTNSATYAPHNKAQLDLSVPAMRATKEKATAHPLQLSKFLKLTNNPTCDLLRSKIYDRSGRNGFRGLVRVLRILDDNGNRMLDKYELQNGLQMFGMQLTSSQLDDVMRVMDTDGSGQVDITEFMRFIRGEMSDERKELVMLAYANLDRARDRHVTLADLQELYDVSKHPSVLSKEKTPQQVSQEFINGWDKNRDGVIILEEFIDYYNDISAGIDNDEYFELMIRNAWHLSGGSGASANTSCRRVLVVHNDGKQTVEEIKNDIGIKQTDMDKILENLRRQGIVDIKRIEFKF